MRMVNIKISCEFCGREFDNKKSYTNHRRWHDFPEYKEYQKNVKKELKRVLKGKITGKKNPNYNKFGDENTFGGKKHSKKTRKLMKQKQKDFWNSENGDKAKDKQRKICLNGHASYMLSCNSNPSKPQIELYNMILELCPYAILNYPCLNYSIDIAISFLEVAIEYDEPYWHQDKEYDVKRQRRLEKEGWKFIRFSTLTSKMEIKNKLENIRIEKE